MTCTPEPGAETHLIEVSCNCGDIEHCDLERYISDVRILHQELDGYKLHASVRPRANQPLGVEPDAYPLF